MKVALIIKNRETNKVDLIKIIRHYFNIEISLILKNIALGEPIFVKELFDETYELNFSIQLLNIIENLDHFNIAYSLYELSYQEEYLKDQQYGEITIDIIKNMITSRNQDLDQFYD
ncbi:hypothetical protein [Proteus sp. FME41]|uniref:hypothetical protein n=1 Tax=Proteus sp. FME41 TaxID=2742608 RepID=UPI0018689AEE|nr:hypothetical protein [Proteus sp. FME41]